MKTLSIAIACLPLCLLAQQVGAQPVLSGEQKEGRRVFQQKCAVCHLPIVPSGDEPYARRLSGTLVERNEEYVRQAITTGNGAGMPGWKYTLRPDQIDSLIAYLKTVDATSPTVSGEAPEL